MESWRGACQVRLWAVDRTQSEIVEGMKTTLTGLEYGLAGYWRALCLRLGPVPPRHRCPGRCCALRRKELRVLNAPLMSKRASARRRTLDECAGGRARDRFGRHDGQLSGCRWIRSDVRLRFAAATRPQARPPSLRRCSRACAASPTWWTQKPTARLL